MQPTHFNRRQFLATSGIALSVANIGWGESNRPSRILLRSSWQTVNIGDIAHTPGVLRILETHLPQAEITLWPSYVDNGVRELLTSRFPRLKIATRGSEELERAFKECDFFLHGSPRHRSDGQTGIDPEASGHSHKPHHRRSPIAA